MKKEKEKVSVIIPVYNTSKYLNKCLDSVINQSYQNLEIIIINDCSTDNSLNIIKKYQDKRIKIFNLSKRSGVSIARNRGIEISTGNYLCFLDSDDFWDLDKISKQVKFMKENNYTFIYSNYAYYNHGNLKEVIVPKSITYKQALKNTTIFTSTVMFNMKYLTKDDIYMPIIERGQDTSCWWKVLKKGITAYSLNEILAYYRIDNKSLSSNKLIALKRTWHIYSLENINLLKRIYYFSFYVINAIKRRI